jgi:hypothetical protein
MHILCFTGRHWLRTVLLTGGRLGRSTRLAVHQDAAMGAMGQR